MSENDDDDDCARRIPAEWDPHIACLLLYPHNPYVFRSPIPPLPSSSSSSSSSGKCGPARKEVRNVARAIARRGGEDVWIYCNTDGEAEELRKLLEREEEEEEAAQEGATEEQRDLGGGAGRIRVSVCPSDDSWMRDTGPTFVVRSRRRQRRRPPRSNSAKDGSEFSAEDDKPSDPYLDIPTDLVGLDWSFNAYGGPPAADGSGGCYWPCDLDRAVASNVVDHLGGEYRSSSSVSSVRRRPVDLVLEGGSINVDGEGTVLTTEECLLNPNRNPALTKGGIETILLRELGASKILWLPLGLAFDADTNGHVDNFCAFARPGEVLLAWTDDEDGDGENYRRCRLAEATLERERDARGRRMHVRRLRLPRPLRYTEEEVRTLESEAAAEARIVGERLAASYVNFYVANGAVVVPQFGDEERDAEALATLSEAFPDRRVVGVYSREILLGGGNIHCITQQVPSVNMSSSTA